MRRTQHAPKLITIGIAVILVIIGVLGTFAGGTLVPQNVGIWAYVAATVVLLLGVFLPFV